MDELKAMFPEAKEFNWEMIRIWRDRKLAASDWTQTLDAPVDKAAWATYRQALRDLPDSKKNPRDIELPVKPGGNN